MQRRKGCKVFMNFFTFAFLLFTFYLNAFASLREKF